MERKSIVERKVDRACRRRLPCHAIASEYALERIGDIAIREFGFSGLFASCAQERETVAVVVYKIVFSVVPTLGEFFRALSYFRRAERIAVPVGRYVDVDPGPYEVRARAVQKVVWIDDLDTRLAADIRNLRDIVVSKIDPGVAEPSSEEVGTKGEIAPEDATQHGLDLVLEFGGNALE